MDTAAPEEEASKAEQEEWLARAKAYLASEALEDSPAKPRRGATAP